MTNEIVWDIFLWQLFQGAVLTAVVVLSCVLLKRSPRWCFWLWLVVLLKLIIPPTLMSPLSLFAWMRIGVETLMVPAGTVARPGMIPWKENLAEFNALSPYLFAGIWFAGAFLAAGSAYWRCRRFFKLLRRAIVPTPVHVNRAVRSIATRMGLSTRIRVLVTSEPIGPAVFGMLRPTIVLPEGILNQSSEKLNAILAHEVVHIKRRDALFTMFIAGVKVIWWFNPLVWLAASRANQFAERTCDLEVIRFLKLDRGVYAHCLVDVLAAKQQYRPVFGLPGVRASELTRERIRTIMTASLPTVRSRRSKLTLGAVVALLLVLTLPGKPPTACYLIPTCPCGCIEKAAPIHHHGANQLERKVDA